MTSRLRDVLPLTVGAYLVALGLLFGVDAVGVYELGPGRLAEGAVGLALVALGVLSILAALRVRRVARRLRRAIGHVRSAERWTVDDAVIQTVFGDIHLDLREADLPEGETELTLLCWLGTIEVRAPAGLDLDVTAQTMVGSVDILGRREEGFIRDIRVTTPGFASSPRRLRMRLSAAVGELTVLQERASRG
jgi:predicted membrane protein